MHDTRVCGSIPVHTGELPADKAELYVDKIRSRTRFGDSVTFHATTDPNFKHGLIGLPPSFVIRVAYNDQSPQVYNELIKRHSIAMKKWYQWCVNNCESEFTLTEDGFVFDSADDCFLFKIVFGETLHAK